MSDLRQASNGKWKIVGIKHDQPGVSVPAEYTYKGSKKTFNITTSEKTIVTDWETPLGEAIKLADITRTYTDVVDGNKIYRVKLPENFTIHPAGAPDPDPTISLKVSPTTTIPSDGGTIRYTATTTPTDTEIEVKCSNDLSIIKTTKTGSFSVPANSSESQITYRVSAYCADNPSIIATGSVKQAAYVPPVEDEFGVTQIQGTFHYGGETTSMAFQIINPQGHGWTASTVPSWVHLSDNGGEDTTYIDVEVDARTDGGTNQRIGEIIITDNDTRKTYTVTVTQDGFVPELILTAVGNPIPATETSLTYNVKCNTNVTVKYGTQENTHSATQSVTDGFTIAPNETTSPISHTITAFCTDYPNVSTSVTITQQGAESSLKTPKISWAHWAYLSTSPTSQTINFGLDGGASILNIYANDDTNKSWTIVSAVKDENTGDISEGGEIPAWLSISKMSGTGDQEITITAAPATSARNCYIALKKPCGNGARYIIFFEIKQGLSI